MLLQFTQKVGMKNIIKISIAILVLHIGNFLNAQTYTIDNSSKANLQIKADQFKLFSSQAASNSNSKNVSASNNIYIQQIGNSNDIISNTRSIYSDVGLFQKGNNNEILLDVTAGVIKQNVLQAGINNNVIDFNKGSVVHTATVLQRGANQNLIMLGSNSISNNMIISMQGKNQTILVRNLKN